MKDKIKKEKVPDPEDHEEDVYEEKDVEELLDEDELQDREAAFMEGYDRETDKEFKGSQPKKKKKRY